MEWPAHPPLEGGGGVSGTECPVPLTNWWGATNGSQLQEPSPKTSWHYFSSKFVLELLPLGLVEVNKLVRSHSSVLIY